MITKFSAKNYGCLKDVTCALTPLHAFIGPNDSGKSTLLRGLLDVAETAAGSVNRGHHNDRYSPRTQRLSVDFFFKDAFPEPVRYTLADAATTLERLDRADGQTLHIGEYGELEAFLQHYQHWAPPPASIPRAGADFHGAAIVRFDADRLKSPSSLIPGPKADSFIVNRGLGLPGLLDLIVNRGDDTFRALVDQVKGLFPTIKRVALDNVSETEKALLIELNDGTLVPAGQLSEGLLYFLAFRALSVVKNVSVLLVEEPENGLHPSRIADIVRVLRAIVAAGTQVILATHSPLVINELQPEEVSVVTRTAEAGTRVTPMKETANFASRSKVYALGELWLSYANGVDESPLIDGGPSPAVVLP